MEEPEVLTYDAAANQLGINRNDVLRLAFQECLTVEVASFGYGIKKDGKFTRLLNGSAVPSQPQAEIQKPQPTFSQSCPNATSEITLRRPRQMFAAPYYQGRRELHLNALFGSRSNLSPETEENSHENF